MTNPANPTEPKPIVRWDELGPTFSDPDTINSFDDQVQHWNVAEHVAAGSEFELVVMCPSLAARARKARAEAINSHLYRQSILTRLE